MQHEYSMPGYFQSMPVIGKPLSAANPENEAQLKQQESELEALAFAVCQAGKTDEAVHASGRMTAMERIRSLCDEGSFRPLNSLYNPGENGDGSTAIVKGLGRVHGKWAVVVASDNKKLAGAWVPGQSENLLRASDTAKCLRIPLVYLLECSGVKLDEQEKVYAGRRGGGTPFYRNAELQRLGIPVLVGIFGTNPAGGGYHAISPTILIAQAGANLAVGGAGILGGMNPKGLVDREGAEQLVAAANGPQEDPPGSVAVHYGETGFIREAYAEEAGVLEGIRKYLDDLPSYNPDFFRVDDPKEPLFAPEELYSVVPMNQKRAYNAYEVLARLFDGSEFTEFKKGYGPELIIGLAKVDGLLIGAVINVQGMLVHYPEYKKNAVGIGGKLYRQGLLKLNEFVNLCGRDRIPIVWLQDTTGIDVGDDAERAELLSFGPTSIYSNESSGIPQVEITLRKGTSSAHYSMGGPMGSHNALSLGTAATVMRVMNGGTAAVARYSRRLRRQAEAGEDLQPTIDLMNELIDEYDRTSTPRYCAQSGLVDEVVAMPELRAYLKTFVACAYQNPASLCPVHQMLLPRVMREYETFRKP